MKGNKSATLPNLQVQDLQRTIEMKAPNRSESNNIGSGSTRPTLDNNGNETKTKRRKEKGYADDLRMEAPFGDLVAVRSLTEGRTSELPTENQSTNS